MSSKTTIAQPAPPSTRFTRGITLAAERFEKITRVAPYIWSVPSCTGEGVYAVNLQTSECSCPDRVPEDEHCKHASAARYVKARTATCSGCSARFRHRELYEVGEGNLTFFEGELLCRSCGLAHGVL
jgi:hypothetical protein